MIDIEHLEWPLESILYLTGAPNDTNFFFYTCQSIPLDTDTAYLMGETIKFN